MSTLLIELRGPQQAWGSRSRFAVRATELAPTKSGVVGMIAAALGMERTAPLDRFADLRFGVRIDQPGRVERDFQTTRSFDGRHSYPLSQRYYLADAVFVVGVEGAETELATYREALARPYFPLFLGRRAFPPEGPLDMWLVPDALEPTLEQHPWRARAHHRRRFGDERVRLQIVQDAGADAGGETRPDVPVSFDPRRRRYESREVASRWIDVPHPDPSRRAAPPTPTDSAPRRHGDPLLGSPTTHDPESLLADEEV